MTKHERIENAIKKVIRLNNERKFKRGRAQGNLTIALADAIDELEYLREKKDPPCLDPELHEFRPCDCAEPAPEGEGGAMSEERPFDFQGGDTPSIEALEECYCGHYINDHTPRQGTLGVRDFCGGGLDDRCDCRSWEPIRPQGRRHKEFCPAACDETHPCDCKSAPEGEAGR